MRLALRIILPILILAGCGALARHFIVNQEPPKKFTPPPQMTKVEGATIVTGDYQIMLDTRGTVRPRTTTSLYPEVSGRIVSISPNFREGGFFAKDAILVSIEKLDYESALVTARSQLAQAKRALEEEKARGDQAAENWRRLGKKGEPTELVLRIPQMDEARALIQAAEADVERAERNLARTDIRAPYAGRILEQNVDIGQYISQGTQIGRAFATDVMEVRLPLTNQQLGFVDLPEAFRNDKEQKKGPKVWVTAKIGRDESTWEGEVVRVDSSIDQASRQLFVVAQIHDPYRREPGHDVPLKIGMFVDAKVEGLKLDDVIVLPRSTVRVSGEVILIDDQSKIKRQQVESIWKGKDEVVFPNSGGGLSEGDVICLTPIAYPVDGAPVLATIDGKERPVEFPGGKGKGKGGAKGMSGKGKGPGSDAATAKTPAKAKGNESS